MATGHPIPLTVPQLLDRAREISNVDLEDTPALEPLSVLVNSFNQEAQLHEAGAHAVQDRLLRHLANRLRMLRDFAAHPEIRSQSVRAPIFIAGYLRTGSTKLHRMLSASGDFNHLKLWMTLNPSSLTGKPGEDTFPRTKDTDQFVCDLYSGSPEAASIHEQGAFLAEEESYIFCQDLRCAGFLSYANVPSYLRWLAMQDLRPTYDYLLDALKYLQWQGLADPNRRWILKSPFHMGQEKALLNTFPDATLLFTHRPPEQFLVSMCSLMAGYMKWHTDHTAVEGPALVAGFVHSMESHFAFRSSNTATPYLDLDYRDVTADSEAAVRRVYDLIQMPLSATATTNMRQWELSNPIHKHGGHRYKPEEFGLTEDGIRLQCRRYDNFYKERFAERHRS